MLVESSAFPNDNFNNNTESLKSSFETQTSMHVHARPTNENRLCGTNRTSSDRKRRKIHRNTRTFIFRLTISSLKRLRKRKDELNSKPPVTERFECQMNMSWAINKLSMRFSSDFNRAVQFKCGLHGVTRFRKTFAWPSAFSRFVIWLYDGKTLNSDLEQWNGEEFLILNGILLS